MNPIQQNAINAGLAAAVLLLAALAGCASIDEAPYMFSEGWRDAKVVEVVSGADVNRPRFWKCLRDVPEQERLKRTYVIASYRGPHHRQQHLVSAPAGEALRPGDKVHLHASACENAIVRRDEPRQ